LLRCSAIGAVGAEPVELAGVALELVEARAARRRTNSQALRRVESEWIATEYVVAALQLSGLDLERQPVQQGVERGVLPAAFLASLGRLRLDSTC
jgi:hypothetical protein